MSRRYSPSTGGFYETDLHGNSIPGDAIYVAPARHFELMAAQAEGATIEPSSETGNPIIVPPPAPRADAMAASLKSAVRIEADRRAQLVMPLAQQVAILRRHAVGGEKLSPATLAAFAELDALQSAVDAIDADIEPRSAEELRTYSVRDNTLWPEAR